jgi:murein L,D-transpeptidase YcbB/YkuD
MRTATNQKCGGKAASDGAGTNGVDEQQWVSTYVNTREAWLKSVDSLRATVYRMKAFRSLIDSAKWDLPLPLQVHGVIIDEAELAADSSRLCPVLCLTDPVMTGRDVKTLQAALEAAGFPCGDDGAFTPEVERALKSFQASKKLAQDGIAGPATWAALA